MVFMAVMPFVSSDLGSLWTGALSLNVSERVFLSTGTEFLAKTRLRTPQIRVRTPLNQPQCEREFFGNISKIPFGAAHTTRNMVEQRSNRVGFTVPPGGGPLDIGEHEHPDKEHRLCRRVCRSQIPKLLVFFLPRHAH
jgi:hypothetical protein